VAIAAAAEAAKHVPDTPEIEAEVERIYAAGRRMMAQHRYQDNALHPVHYGSPEIRPEIQAMPRADVNARLAEMRANYPALQHAHREGDNLSDDDLRAMLEDATKLTKDME
jgi:hypothetical protein